MNILKFFFNMKKLSADLKFHIKLALFREKL